MTEDTYTVMLVVIVASGVVCMVCGMWSKHRQKRKTQR
jgi:hypothetical protein